MQTELEKVHNDIFWGRPISWEKIAKHQRIEYNQMGMIENLLWHHSNDLEYYDIKIKKNIALLEWFLILKARFPRSTVMMREVNIKSKKCQFLIVECRKELKRIKKNIPLLCERLYFLLAKERRDECIRDYYDRPRENKLAQLRAHGKSTFTNMIY